jgi:hypothetical protein
MTHGPRAFTSILVTRPLSQRGPTCHGKAPKSQAHGVRHGARSRLPRVPTHNAKQPGRHLVVCAIPSSSQHLTVCASTSPSRHPTRRASAGGEGSTQNHPAALRLGMQMGFEPPEQHYTAHSPYKRERTQVRLAARVEHRGGFGTCVPGAWTGQAIPTTRRSAGRSAESRTSQAARATGLSPGSTAWTYPRTNGRRGCETRTAKPDISPTNLRVRNPPRSRATKPPPVARGPEPYPYGWPSSKSRCIADRSPRNSGSHRLQTSPRAGNDSTAAQDERPQPSLGTRYPTQSTARGPRSSPGSAQPGTWRELPSPHQFRTDHEQARDSD